MKEVIVNCTTGRVTVRNDTFLATKPVAVPVSHDRLATRKADLQSAAEADVKAGRISPELSSAIQSLLSEIR